MSYIATISVMFPCPVSEVYEALCDLGSYPRWIKSMKRISYTGSIRLGLRYETETIVAGRVNLAKVEVVRLVPDKEIELVNEAGLVTYRVLFRLISESHDTTEVACALRFEFRNLVMDLARPAIEDMAKARLREDLENLRALLRPSSN